MEHQIRALQHRARRQLGLLDAAAAEMAGDRTRRHAGSPSAATHVAATHRGVVISVGGVAFARSAAGLYSVWKAPNEPEVLVDAAVVRNLVNPAVLARRALELRNSKRPGCRKVPISLAEQHPELHHARNEWEALVVRRGREYDLPEPELNYAVVVGGQQRFLDVAWPLPLRDLEFDGFAPHMVRSVFDDDRVRQNALVPRAGPYFA